MYAKLDAGLKYSLLVGTRFFMRSSWEIRKQVARSSRDIAKRVAISSQVGTLGSGLRARVELGHWEAGCDLESSWGVPKEPTACSNDT